MDAQNRIIEEDDTRFVARCRQGETEAFSHLVRRHQKKMLNLAFRIIGDYEEACDVVQESFLSAFRSIRTFRGEAQFSTWLSSIVLNHSRSHLKQRAARLRREELSLDDPQTPGEGISSTGPCSQEESVIERLEKRDLEARVQKCLETLDNEQREVVVLRDIQGFSYEAIGLTLKLPLGTVRSRLFRARNALKDCLFKARDVLR